MYHQKNLAHLRIFNCEMLCNNTSGFINGSLITVDGVKL